MRNAQAKIDTLLDLLVDRLQDEIATGVRDGEIHENPLLAGPPTEKQLAELERLIVLSNLNNKKKELVEKVSPQGQGSTMTNEELVASLKATRDPDLFPRRGPRKGKRENPSVPYIRPTCAIHTSTPCVAHPDDPLSIVCPECVKEVPPDGFVSLKALL